MIIARPMWPTTQRQSWGSGGRSQRLILAPVTGCDASVCERMNPVVHLSDAVAVLGRFPVLAGATLDVERGEILLLQGPNGAGKTSLLRLCAGLLPLDRGEGTGVGCDLRTNRDALRKRVGLLGHANGLYGDLTVTENVRFWGSTVGATAAEVQAAMERMALAERLGNVQVNKLSAGQKRRTALACLVARRAELWLLDEPHAGLDAAARDELDSTLRDAAAGGATIIVASHELERAGALSTRSVEVIGGLIRETRPTSMPTPLPTSLPTSLPTVVEGTV